jgi:hypothetical protein
MITEGTDGRLKRSAREKLILKRLCSHGGRGPKATDRAHLKLWMSPAARGADRLIRCELRDHFGEKSVCLWRVIPNIIF